MNRISMFIGRDRVACVTTTEEGSMGGQQVKVMYYAPLPEGRSHAAFSARWRQHGELAMGLPMWRHMARYVQFDALVAGQHGLADEQLGMLRNAGYGGGGAVWFPS